MNEISEIGYINVWCADLTGTREFFKSLAGLPIAYESDDVVVFGIAGTQLILRRAYAQTEYRAGTVQIGFYLDTLDSLLKEVRESTGHLAIEEIRADAEQPSTTVRTPSGQYVEFTQRRTKEEEQTAESG